MKGAAVALALASGIASASAAAGATGDLHNGEAVYARCAGCHSLAYDRTGPRHCGLIGRRAGTVEGFGYSAAMKRSNLVWDEKTLDRFLADPAAIVRGTSMGYAGVSDARDRADLIAYLVAMNASQACRG